MVRFSTRCIKDSWLISLPSVTLKSFTWRDSFVECINIYAKIVLEQKFTMSRVNIIIGITFMFCLGYAFAYESTSSNSSAARSMARVYDECTKSGEGFVPCLKKKAIAFLGKVSTVDSLNLGEGIRVVRAASASPIEVSQVENDLEHPQFRGSVADDDILNTLLMERIVLFFSGRSLQVDFPRISSEELGRGIEEGRGKMKKMMGMMMMGIAMKMVGMIPVAIAALYLLAGKALIVSKIALLLAGIVGLKKLLAGRGGGTTGSSVSSYSAGTGGWSSGGSHGGGSWDRRSIDDAQDIAYRSYSKSVS